MSKPVSVQFLFDFGSPNAYMCHRVIPRIEARTGVRFEYVPILLGGLFKLTGNRSPAEAFAGIPNKRAYDKLEIARFVAKHGLDRYRPNPHWPVNTLQVMRGAVAAQKQGCFERYVEVVNVAMWEEGRNMEDPAVIVRTLDEAGLDGRRLYEGTQDPEVKSMLMANTQSAHERGAFGSPSFFVGQELFFGKDRLREVEEEIVRQSQSQSASA
ncbi:2-hydroxychromene-2-carboxylate isomerase [Variovorax defluvii]|uniref:2-hydroxychromene-2-carboxylate isomerase n=1 Tax=Variovorax defluvii TaxID=913761 RepID=A0ABP8H3V8_9BURK